MWACVGHSACAECHLFVLLVAPSPAPAALEGPAAAEERGLLHPQEHRTDQVSGLACDSDVALTDRPVDPYWILAELVVGPVDPTCPYQLALSGSPAP